MNGNRPRHAAIGVDFGTLSGRALVVRVEDGAELGAAVHPYAHGVVDAALPETGRVLRQRRHVSVARDPAMGGHVVTAAVDEVPTAVCALHAELTRHGLDGRQRLRPISPLGQADVDALHTTATRTSTASGDRRSEVTAP